jgi:hypothetical protein
MPNSAPDKGLLEPFERFRAAFRKKWASGKKSQKRVQDNTAKLQDPVAVRY